MTEQRAMAGGLDIHAAIRYLHDVRHRLPQFVVYDHPSDWPDFFVARLWFALPDQPQSTPFVIMDHSLDRLQTTMEALGLVKLMRHPDDDPKILETWT